MVLKKYSIEEWIESLKKYGNITDKQKTQLKKIKKKFDQNDYNFKKTFFMNRIKGFIEYGVEDKIESRLIKLSNMKKGVTLDKMIISYGEKEGTKKYKEYVEKQRISNTFEYKKEKYGFSQSDFDEYNKSRAITLENMKKKYGEKEGTKKYKEYVEKQKDAGCTLKYFIEKYGEKEGTKKYKELCNKKAHMLDNYIFKYGEKEGKKKYIDFFSSNVCGYSKMSQKLFWSLYNSLDFNLNLKVYFAELNNEFARYDNENKCCKKYDFVLLYNDFKLCIEFNGDHYHGNPKYYKPNQILKKGRGFKNKRIKSKDKWKEDYHKANLLLNDNFKYIVIWESDYVKDEERTINNIKEYIYKNYGIRIFR